MSLAPDIRTTEIPSVLEIFPPVFPDHRGFFTESFNEATWAAAGFRESFVQDNLSFSGKGVLRGLHYQLHPHAVGKLIRVITGAVYDVVVDLRKGSPSFGKWVGRTLTEESASWLWAPPGFAHGFLSLQANTRVYYKCTAVHVAEAERAIRYNDPVLRIDWPVPVQIISDKDRLAPLFAESEHNFLYEP